MSKRDVSAADDRVVCPRCRADYDRAYGSCPRCDAPVPDRSAAGDQERVERIQKLMNLRYAMQGADVPVVLTSWMREVEKILSEVLRVR